MLNFEVDRDLLEPLVPQGTELDAWQGKTLISMVGFLFQNTRVLGWGLPWHRDFEEVNLRFYVRRRSGLEWRRAVVFVKEIVPRCAVAFVARALYGENYVALPMRHLVEPAGSAGVVRRVLYAWNFGGRENRIELAVEGAAEPIREGTEEEFITEHYWGYSRRRTGGTLEYRVEHPRWRVWAAREACLDCDAAGLYGRRFAEWLRRPPTSAFLAEGSEVAVFRGVPLRLP
jgi:hypothetical protein